MTNQWSMKLPTEPGWYWCSGGTDREPSPMRVVWHCEKLQVIIDGLGFQGLQHCESWSWMKIEIPNPPAEVEVIPRKLPEAFNSDRWASQLTLHMAGEFKKDKYAEHNTTGRTKAWIDGWQRAWTEAFIALCSVIEEQYTHPDSMLLRWVGIEVAESWPQESVVLRRWKSRETNQWKYAVCELRNEWGYGAESQFLLIERSCNAEA